MPFELTLIQIIVLALIQGAAELLPVSSSAHVIVAEKLMGLDPSSPAMTFLLVMLHTGTMFAVLLYFWPRWKKLNREFFKMTLVATVVTAGVGLTLKKFIETVILGYWLGESHAEIEHLFKSLPLIAFSLFSVGIFIFFTGHKTDSGNKNVRAGAEKKRKGSKQPVVSHFSAMMIGAVQGLCLPFRGFSRSGATISTALLLKMTRAHAEDFSFALAVILTPPIVVKELYRLLKSAGHASDNGVIWSGDLWALILPGLLGMVFSFGSGLLALRFLSIWLEKGRWKFFGIYCILAAFVVITLWRNGF